ncbi:hypothetical protein MES5069_130029 [Mesorhizobium escarrei]|uniref:Uncharacterized protein n=1 Tax=Mesorhizobium escarrei TaxID=666018 RepID=A0ABM9DHH8_9HYPH|nr:hypothetical protein MES5069_130029 [Mesorhizobium escarrei]
MIGHPPLRDGNLPIKDCRRTLPAFYFMHVVDPKSLHTFGRHAFHHPRSFAGLDRRILC